MTAPTVSPADSPAPHTGPSLSPSRAADFKTCPLLFRFRTIDRLPEQPTADQVRGTLVHAVLEALFDLPAAERTPEAAAALVAPSWQRLLADEPELAEIFAAATEPPSLLDAAGRPIDTAASPGLATGASGASVHPAAASADLAATSADLAATSAGLAAAFVDPAAADAEADATGGVGPDAGEQARLAAFLAGAQALLPGYFAVEDPSRLEPAERETLVSTLVDDELLIRGYIDRLDVSPTGDLRVVDYKTGGAPREAFEGRALFQLKFYALVLWRTRGVVPRVLRLVYLKDAEVCDYSPDAEELERFERTLVALSQAIERAKHEQTFLPKRSRLCAWCSHQAFCPEFGGTPPPYPTTSDDLLQPTPTDDDRLA
ncbi:PD-(D/E)XK nuclease family protein [Actinoplanes sp. Pm04-4]|uniref:PD-(D/E)XK nuclease family protein n=1 Tax=Paractinoplanes pyxinae TaxID=2997416 RepID=A0ABT4AZ40_9ACTN|nr:PD-(D/E)XK nuclease family protein [Actinoplanes pyxinae]MCY1139508.1 PD-(D/E)XK nuclease family protein [Actinoplanes pyxinae]